MKYSLIIILIIILNLSSSCNKDDDTASDWALISAGQIEDNQIISSGEIPDPIVDKSLDLGLNIKSYFQNTYHEEILFTWEYSLDNHIWIEIKNADKDYYSPEALHQTTFYRRVIHFETSTNSITHSNIVIITVLN